MRRSLHHQRGAIRAAEREQERVWSSQVGETLIELLLAIVLMGVAFSAILSGMITSSRIARMNQEHTRANVVLSAAADRLLEPKNPGAFKYRPCGAANNGVPDDNNGDAQWNGPWASYPGYTPQVDASLLPATWRIRIKDARYLLGPDYFNRAPNASFGPNDDNVIVPQWSAWGAAGFNRCADLKSMNLTAEQVAMGVQQRDGGLQQLRLVVEKPDGTGPHSYEIVDELVVTKRDQRCPTTNYSNADRGPC